MEFLLPSFFPLKMKIKAIYKRLGMIGAAFKNLARKNILIDNKFLFFFIQEETLKMVFKMALKKSVGIFCFPK